MAGATWLLNVITSIAGHGEVERCFRQIAKERISLRELTDEEIIERCVKVLSAPKKPPSGREDGWRRLYGSRLPTESAYTLALGAEALRLFPPAGLAVGDEIYDTQIIAAIHMCRGALVQMDTGEGKTLSIMLASFALLAQYDHVVIATANPYLAQRDAWSASHFWSKLGVRVGLALPDQYETPTWAGWGARVVYTLPKQIVFRHLHEVMSEVVPSFRISGAALLLDEADSAILDELSNPFSLAHWFQADTADWGRAIELARMLEDDDVVVRLGAWPDVVLTSAGESTVRARAGQCGAGETLALLREVELVYLAERVAIEGSHYEMVDGAPVLLDATSGWQDRTSQPEWLSALEALKGRSGAARRRVSLRTQGLHMVQSMHHVAGTSGTIVNEAIDYMLTLAMPVASVPPRHPRQRGLRDDTFASDWAMVLAHVAESVSYYAPSRPVMVVTGSIPQAEAIASHLRTVADGQFDVRFVSGVQIFEEAVFQEGGRPGVVIVSTRVAGRGVDVRLSEEARAAGGAVLIAIGHAIEERLDRQLLGRIGRTGDPYTAWFVSHPNDELMKRALTGMGRKMLLAAETGDSRMMTKAVARTQRTLRRQRLLSLAASAEIVDVQGDLTSLFENWLLLRQIPDRQVQPNDAFYSAVARRWVELRFPIFVDERAIISDLVARALIEALVELGVPTAQAADLEPRIVGATVAEALERATAVLTDAVREANSANERARRLTKDRVRCAAELGSLRGVRDRLAEIPASGDALRPPLWTDAVSPPLQVGFERVTAQLVLAGGPRSHIQKLLQYSEEQLLDTQAVDEVFSIVMSLRDSGTSCDPATLVAVSCVIVRLERARAPLAGGLTDVVEVRLEVRRSDRTPLHLATEAIVATHADTEEQLSRMTVELRRQRLNPARYANAHRDVIEGLMVTAETSLLTSVLRHTLASGDLASLDVFFAASESSAARSTSRVALPHLRSAAELARSEVVAHRVPNSTAELITSFVEHELGSGRRSRWLSTEQLYPALRQLVGTGDLPALNSEDRVQKVLQTWYGSGERATLMPWQRRAVDAAVRRFVDYLNQLGLAAARPRGLRLRARTLARRAVDRGRSPRLLMVAATFIVSAVAVSAARLVPTRGGVHFTQPGLDLTGRVLAGGFLRSGDVFCAVVLSVTGALLVAHVVGADSAARGTTPIDSMIGLSAGVVIPVALVRPWQANGMLPFSASLLLVVASSAAVIGVTRLIWSAEAWGRVRLSEGFLACTVLFSALPFALPLGGRNASIVAAVAVGWTLLLHATWRPGLLLVGLKSGYQVGSPDISVTSSVRRRVPVNFGFVLQAQALVAAWVSAMVAAVVTDSTHVESIAAVAGWLGLMTYGVTSVVRAATDFGTWQELLRDSHQAVVHGSLASAITSVRRSLVLRSALAYGIPLALALILLPPSQRIGDHIPLWGAVLLLGSMAVNTTVTFVLSLNTAMFEAGITSPGKLDDSGPAAITDSLRALGRRLWSALGALTLLILVIRFVSNAIGFIDAMKAIWHGIQSAWDWIRERL